MLYHRLLGGDAAVPFSLQHGLLPLSAKPSSDRWRQVQDAYPDLFPSPYAQFAESVI